MVWTEWRAAPTATPGRNTMAPPDEPRTPPAPKTASSAAHSALAAATAAGTMSNSTTLSTPAPPLRPASAHSTPNSAAPHPPSIRPGSRPDWNTPCPGYCSNHLTTRSRDSDYDDDDDDDGSPRPVSRWRPDGAPSSHKMAHCTCPRCSPATWMGSVADPNPASRHDSSDSPVPLPARTGSATPPARPTRNGTSRWARWARTSGCPTCRRGSSRCGSWSGRGAGVRCPPWHPADCTGSWRTSQVSPTFGAISGFDRGRSRRFCRRLWRRGVARTRRCSRAGAGSPGRSGRRRTFSHLTAIPCSWPCPSPSGTPNPGRGSRSGSWPHSCSTATWAGASGTVRPIDWRRTRRPPVRPLFHNVATGIPATPTVSPALPAPASGFYCGTRLDSSGSAWSRSNPARWSAPTVAPAWLRGLSRPDFLG